MHFRSTLSTERDTDGAVEQVCRALDGLDSDLAIVFTSHHHGPEFDNVLAGISDGISARNLIGCTAESIIGPDREIEQAPAIVVWAARMPGVKILPFCIDQSDLQRFMGSPDWHDRLGVTPDEKPSFVVLPEPFSINVDACLQKIDRAYPGSVVVGGVASGANAAGQNRLFTGDQALRQGLVGVSLCGDVRINSVVSQGCRPIGQPFVVTKSEENVISELGGRPALEHLSVLPRRQMKRFCHGDPSPEVPVQVMMAASTPSGRLFVQSRKDHTAFLDSTSRGQWVGLQKSSVWGAWPKS